MSNSESVRHFNNSLPEKGSETSEKGNGGVVKLQNTEAEVEQFTVVLKALAEKIQKVKKNRSCLLYFYSCIYTYLTILIIQMDAVYFPPVVTAMPPPSVASKKHIDRTLFEFVSLLFFLFFLFYSISCFFCSLF
jgi:hypothetical protein